MKSPQRTLRRAVRLSDHTVVTSDELLSLEDASYYRLRHLIRAKHDDGSDEYVCDLCGHPVYAPLTPGTRQPFWRHYKGAPQNCPWHTGKPSSIDQVSAQQFQGMQESPLHRQLKEEIGAILVADKRTAVGSVCIDRYQVSEDGRRRPDVFAVYDGQPTVFEIQLSTTQLPIILGRETFYQRNGARLVWITWNFESKPLSQIQAAFKDIFYLHNQTLLSVDPDSISTSRARRTLHLRAFSFGDEGWTEKLVPLHDLEWTAAQLPSVTAVSAWSSKAIAEWRRYFPARSDWQLRNSLLDQLGERLGTDRTELEVIDAPSLIGLAMSLNAGKPIDTRESNLIARVNSFLNPSSRHRYRDLVLRLIDVFGQRELLDRDTVRSKLELAGLSEQAPHDDLGWRSIAI